MMEKIQCHHNLYQYLSNRQTSEDLLQFSSFLSFGIINSIFHRPCLRFRSSIINMKNQFSTQCSIWLDSIWILFSYFQNLFFCFFATFTKTSTTCFFNRIIIFWEFRTNFDVEIMKFYYKSELIISFHSKYKYYSKLRK